ncbi:MAG: hypothetical protein ACOX44_05360 [Limnochordia bacterium]
MPKQRAYRRSGNNRSSAKWWLIWLGVLVLLIVINYLTRPSQQVPKVVDLLDTDYALEVAGTAGWDFHQTLEYDLDGDGVDETIEVIAAVTKDARPGTYQWDDGQPWQVYIKDGDETTHIYNRYVQLGSLDVFVTYEDPPRIGIVETQSAGHALYVITYKGVGDYQAEEWVNLPVYTRIYRADSI